MSNLEQNAKILEILTALDEKLTDDVIENASTEELVQYYEMITKIRAKVKNIK